MGSKKTEKTEKKAQKVDLMTSVMSEIHEKDVKMRPKWHFVALTTLLIALTALLSFLASITTLAIVRDVRFAREFQLFDLSSTTLGRLPWGLAVVAILLIVLLIVVIRKFNFSYQYRMNIFLSMLLGGLSLSVLILAVIPAGQSLGDRAAELGPVGGFRRFVEARRVTGQVIDVREGSIILDTEKEGRIEVWFPEDGGRKDFFQMVLEPGEEIDAVIDEDRNGPENYRLEFARPKDLGEVDGIKAQPSRNKKL